MKTQSLKTYTIEKLKVGDMLLSTDWFAVAAPYDDTFSTIDPLLGIFGEWFSGSTFGVSSSLRINVAEGSKLLLVETKTDPLGEKLYFLHEEMKFALREDELERFIDFFDVVLFDEKDCNP